MEPAGNDPNGSREMTPDAISEINDAALVACVEQACSSIRPETMPVGIGFREIAAWLWPGARPTGCYKSLRAALARLRYARRLHEDYHHRWHPFRNAQSNPPTYRQSQPTPAIAARVSPSTLRPAPSPATHSTPALVSASIKAAHASAAVANQYSHQKSQDASENATQPTQQQQEHSHGQDGQSQSSQPAMREVPSRMGAASDGSGRKENESSTRVDDQGRKREMGHDMSGASSGDTQGDAIDGSAVAGLAAAAAAAATDVVHTVERELAARSPRPAGGAHGSAWGFLGPERWGANAAGYAAVHPPPLPAGPPFVVTVIDAISCAEALRVVQTNCVCVRRFIFTSPDLLVQPSCALDVIDVVQHPFPLAAAPSRHAPATPASESPNSAAHESVQRQDSQTHKSSAAGPANHSGGAFDDGEERRATVAFRALGALLVYAQGAQMLPRSNTVINIFSRDPLMHYLPRELAIAGFPHVEIIDHLN